MTKKQYLEFHKACCQKLQDITVAKNADYTGATDDPFANFSRIQHAGGASVEQGFLVRMGDKLGRISSFVETGTLKVKDESVQDTLLDLANYSILFAGYLSRDQISLKDLIDRDELPDNCKAIAKDESGAWWSYSAKPRREQHTWRVSNITDDTYSLPGHVIPDELHALPWEKSLIVFDEEPKADAPTPERIDRSQLPEGTKAIAKDEDGEWYAFTGIPDKDDNCWYAKTAFESTYLDDDIIPEHIRDIPWEESLIRFDEEPKAEDEAISIFRSQLPEGTKAIAKDEDGLWYAYKKMPKRGVECWAIGANSAPSTILLDEKLIPEHIRNIPWKESLRRPGFDL